MIQVTYTYSFLELSGKPKRFIENQPDCTIKGYGVSTDTVTLCVLYESIISYETVSHKLKEKFNLDPIRKKLI